MPAKISADQAEHLAMSLAKGTPHRGKIASTIFRDTLEETSFAEAPGGIPARIAEKVGSVLPGDGQPKKE
jgi:hypothetical protein